MKILDWYKSWFRASGRLCFGAYAKHVAAAYGFFFGFALVSFAIFLSLVQLVAALHAPAWVGWLPIFIHLVLGSLAIGSFVGILATSTIRFVRHLLAGRSEPTGTPVIQDR